MSKTLARSLAAVARAVTAMQRPYRRANTLVNLSNMLIERHTMATPFGAINFVSTHPQALADAFSVVDREPETTAWIANLSADSVLWDVGANIGLYSLLAARRGIRVFAFEPAPASFAALSENIRVNELDNLITALPFAIGSKDGLGALSMSATNAGSVYNSIAGKGDATFRQAVIVYSIDRLIADFGLTPPTHLKIDVDSIEADIIEGGRACIARPTLHSVLVEVDANNGQRERINALLTSAGLTTVPLPPIDKPVNAIYTRA